MPHTGCGYIDDAEYRRRMYGEEPMNKTPEQMISWVEGLAHDQSQWYKADDASDNAEMLYAIRDFIALHSEDDDILTIAYMVGFQKGKYAAKHSQQATEQEKAIAELQKQAQELNMGYGTMDNAELAREIMDVFFTELKNGNAFCGTHANAAIKSALDAKDKAHAAEKDRYEDIITEWELIHKESSAKLSEMQELAQCAVNALDAMNKYVFPKIKDLSRAPTMKDTYEIYQNALSKAAELNITPKVQG